MENKVTVTAIATGGAIKLCDCGSEKVWGDDYTCVDCGKQSPYFEVKKRKQRVKLKRIY